ncbi:hypothetical protein O181_013902 [Austropuccinia psidii MF-1]|uniref:Uncharacterized protein n=1 Tax=Austropuccinia psidii MF-1 TaxID=1389203 RepID=A0A9Q3BZ78_9BASI|nr:hypothetical protein [Austropuccinia psidii MF-1]
MVSHWSDLFLLAIMQHKAHISTNLQAASRPPAFNTPSMKEPDFFDGTKCFKVRSFIQYCQLMFHNVKEMTSEEKKKFHYSTSFLIGRNAKWIEPYLSDLTNKGPSSLLNSWVLLNPNSSLYFGTQMNSEKLKQSCFP